MIKILNGMQLLQLTKKITDVFFIILEISDLENEASNVFRNIVKVRWVEDKITQEN